MSQAPEWIQILQGLLTPAIAAGVGVIAFMQWRTAQQKVVLDLFDRRMATYEKPRQSMRLINSSGKVSDESDRLLLEAESEAAFIFGADIQEYMREIWLIYVQSRTLTRENGYRGREASAQRTTLMEAVTDFYNNGPERFAPYMRMDQKRVSTMNEWISEKNRHRLSYADEKQK
jgi:hypothetical protein